MFKTFSGMTKVKVGKEDLSSAEFVEKRRAALERYFFKKPHLVFHAHQVLTEPFFYMKTIQMERAFMFWSFVDERLTNKY